MYHGLVNDSKTFVDRPLRYSPEKIISEFAQHFAVPTPALDPAKLAQFVEDNFAEVESDLASCEADDWNEASTGVTRVEDASLRQWALEVLDLLRQLCRRAHTDVQLNPERHSLIYVPHAFIVPGGRFREYYYWDAYWIIKGLLSIGLHKVSKGMIANLLYLVETYGYVPNGGRVYYLRRTEPPLLAAMVYEYYNATQDKEFLAYALPLLEKELAFWVLNRRVQVPVGDKVYSMYRYRAESNAPRSESYQEDINFAKGLTDEEAKQKLWRSLASATESGWDFSSRWLTDKSNRITAFTENIVPVDLNAILCWNLRILSQLYGKLGNPQKATQYEVEWAAFRHTFEQVFYVESEAGWFDFNLMKGQHQHEYYASNIVPLFTGCYDADNRTRMERIYDHLDTLGLFNYAGGVPTSLNNASMEQWDYPLGWGPTNHMIIYGLRTTGNARMEKQAFLVAKKWVLENYRTYRRTGKMWEKYDVVDNRPKTGFGWTNGVVLDLLMTYADELSTDDVK
ncbi:trehalase [Aphelenchoides avenae]|nr:trehalase [Aphelenchus avenae]